MEEALAIVVAAVVAGLISYFINNTNTRVQREIIVANKRQEWIDSLRQDVALMLSRCNYLVFKTIDQKNITQKEIDEELAKLTELMHRIQLRLNPKDTEEPHAQLIGATDQIITAIKNLVHKPENIEEYKEIRLLVISLSQIIFKSTWEKVKKGKLS